MCPAISVEDLQIRYRTKNGKLIDAVRGLSFNVEPGEIVGFLGPNGAGKSSTIKALMGFLTPDAGVCKIFDECAGSLEAKRRVGYLPEVALYYPFLTPLETLTLYGELQGLKGKALKNEATELLERVGLGEAMQKQNRSLSKGMLQRVGVAQSLLGTPDLLVLDEVTSGLDPVGRKELRMLLKERQHQGATLFFSSHELSEVDMLCDRILIIDKGHIIDERDMAGLKNELRDFTISFSGDVNVEELAASVSTTGVITTARFDSKAQLIEALDRIHSSKAKVTDVHAEEGSLEDYFVETIGRAA